MTAKDVFFIGFMFLIIGLIFILFFSFEMHRFSGNLERYEDIEILRYLDLSIPVYMVETSGASLAVDIPEDVSIVEEELRARRKEKQTPD